MKKIISVLMPILAIFFLVGGTYYYLNAGNKNFKEEHSKYISLINDSYDFKTGLNGLETLTTEKAKETLRNIDNEVNIASELVKIDNALNNADTETAYERLKQAKKLDTNHTFSKAISYLDTQLDNYDTVLTEILELDTTSPNYADQVKAIIAKYEFKYEALKEKLLAALSHGIKEVLIPKGNEKDIAELPDIVKEGLIITPVKTMDEVLAKALV